MYAVKGKIWWAGIGTLTHSKKVDHITRKKETETIASNNSI